MKINGNSAADWKPRAKYVFLGGGGVGGAVINCVGPLHYSVG